MWGYDQQTGLIILFITFCSFRHNPSRVRGGTRRGRIGKGKADSQDPKNQPPPTFHGSVYTLDLSLEEV